MIARAKDLAGVAKVNGKVYIALMQKALDKVGRGRGKLGGMGGQEEAKVGMGGRSRGRTGVS